MVCHVRIISSPLCTVLGYIIESPESALVPLHTNISFTCSAVGNVFWSVNGLQVQTPRSVQAFANAGIFVPLPTSSVSGVTITASMSNNGTALECLVEEEGRVDILNQSGIVQMLAYGEFIGRIKQQRYSKSLQVCDLL